MLEINWFMLIGSGVLLGLPAPLFYPAIGKDRLVHSRSGRFPLERMLLTWQHWLDFIRAFAGTFILANVAVVFTRPESEVGLPHQDLLVLGGVLFVAVCLQTVQFRKFFYFPAPVFYLWGVTLALSISLYDWIPAVFAIGFSAVIARLGDHLELKLPAMAGILGVTGFLILGVNLPLIMNVALVALPPLLAACSMQFLICYTKDLQAG